MSDESRCHRCGRTLAPAAQFCDGCGLAAPTGAVPSDGIPSGALPSDEGLTPGGRGADTPTMSISTTDTGPPADDGYYYYDDELPPRRVLPWIAALVAIAVLGGAIYFALNSGNSNTSVATAPGGGPVVMPALITFKLKGAIAVLQRDGVTLKQITVQTEPRDDVAPGRVLEQVPLAGTTIDDRIILTVSRRPDSMPKFVGQGINAARATLASLQVTLTVEDSLTAGFPDGTILKQSQAPGAPFADKVTLTVARIPIPTNLGDLSALGDAPTDDDAATIAGIDYPDSLVWAISVCPGVPPVTADYALGGHYRKLVAIAGLRAATPDSADRVRIDIELDGTVVLTHDLDAQSSVPVNLSMLDHDLLTVTFTQLAPTPSGPTGTAPSCTEAHPTLARARLLSTVQSR